ncbi:MAG: class I adenylate-forming enzyme family protein [Solirubrobacteraceae bacterium]
MIATASRSQLALTVPALLAASVDRHPDAEALAAGNVRWTYAEWNRRINSVAAGLAGLGVRRYDRVALFTHTDEPMATLYFAAQRLGAIPVPMNFRLSAGEAAHIIADAGCRLLAYSSELAEVAAEALHRVGGSQRLVVVGSSDRVAPGDHSYDELLQADDEPDPSVPIVPEDVAALMYTSGTTGHAKGVVHTHGNDAMAALNCALEYRLRPDDRALHICPLYHVGGMQAFFIPHLVVGATNVLMARYRPEQALRAIDAQRVTTLFAVPGQIVEMLSVLVDHELDISTLRLITTGGAALPAPAMKQVLDRLCPQLYNGYGMTEASLTLLLHPEDVLTKLGSCGKPTLISQARIVPRHADREVLPTETVEPGAVGQLIVRGPQVAAGYWSDATEQAARFRHGWVYTGDLFHRDADGYYWFDGRADELIVSGGENIYPIEVEATLRRCPGVRDVKVVGLPDAHWGRVVGAFIVRADDRLTDAEVERFCRESGDLAPFKRPRRIVFVADLPRSDSGKVLGRELLAGYLRAGEQDGARTADGLLIGTAKPHA